MYMYQHRSRQNVNTDWIFFLGRGTGEETLRTLLNSNLLFTPLLDMTTRLHAETNTANTESARSATTRIARY